MQSVDFPQRRTPITTCAKGPFCIKVLKSCQRCVAYINFDDDRLYGLKVSELNDVLSALYAVYGNFGVLCLDEVQNIEGWELYVSRLLRQRVRLLVTGSNSKLLSGEIATHLTGRYHAISLFPLSFVEYCSLSKLSYSSNTTNEKGLLTGALYQYLQNGGFPELLSVNQPRDYVSSIFQAIVQKDIQQRFRIRFRDVLEKMANLLVDHFCQEIVISDIKDSLGVGSSHMVEQYLGYLQEAQLLIGLRRFSYKSQIRLRNQKIFVTDVSFVRERENAFSSQNIGWRLENVVFLELLRRCRPQFHDLFYYRNGFEIDFVIAERGLVLELVQVSWDISQAKTFNRDMKSISSMPYLGCLAEW